MPFPETLTPAEIEQLLFLAEVVCSHLETYTLPRTGEKRRDIRIGHTVYVIRARDHGFPASLWNLCNFLEMLNSNALPPDEQDTRPMPALKGE